MYYGDDLTFSDVALRKESVDRNFGSMGIRRGLCVALRKESVDRNFESTSTYYSPPPSLSARRAWIEMISIVVLIIGHI